MSMTVSMDDALKAEFSAVCAEIGMSASTAVNIFARKVVREQRIPFELTARPDGPRTAGPEALSRDRLEALLLEGYEEAEAGRTRTLDDLGEARAVLAKGGPHGS